MKSMTDCYKLSNGVEIPCIGFGTWQTPSGVEATESVKEAIKAGYRHIDTAAVYGNEESIGQGIRESKIRRDDLFITSKLWNAAHGYEETLAAFEETMDRLDMDYLDLYLIHWPNPKAVRDRWEEANAGTWKAFEELYEDGRIRAIGISNFREHHIEALLKTAAVRPMVNQLRLCPGDTQEALAEYCRSKNMILEAYSPLGTGKIFEVPEMNVLAEKYEKSVAQLCIRFSLQKGFLPLPKSVTPARIRENTEVFDFALTPEDVQLISNLTGCAGFATDPDTAPF